jgi:hypothetical protein
MDENKKQYDLPSDIESLAKAQAILNFMYIDQEVRDLYDKGDQLSKDQTKHDVKHAELVRDAALGLVERLFVTAEIAEKEGVISKKQLRMRSELRPFSRNIIVAAAAYLHDIGRAVNVNEHASAGAKWAAKYLSEKAMPKQAVDLICKIIACHRSSTVLKADFDHAAWAIVVIADKAVGDEDRVRPDKAFYLRLMRFFGISGLWKGSLHDKVNFAIKAAKLVVLGNKIVLRIKLDTRVAKPKEIYTLYRSRFHAASKASKYLGYTFALEFNEEMFVFCDEQNNWIPIPEIDVFQEDGDQNSPANKDEDPKSSGDKCQPDGCHCKTKS